MISLSTFALLIDNVCPNEGVALLPIPRVDFKPEATPEQITAANAIIANLENISDPNFDGLITELVYGSNYLAVQTWYDGLRRTQSDYLQKLLTDRDLPGIQQFFDLVDTTPATAELTALLAAFNMPITLN